MDYRLTLTKADVDIIGEALGEIQMKKAIGVFAKIKAQTKAQEDAAACAAAAAQAAMVEPTVPPESHQ